LADPLKPLLVIGAGRGGTSLLGVCLGGHPQIVMRLEYHTADTLIGRESPTRLVASTLDDRFVRFREVCEADRARHPGMIWGNKLTTEQLAGPEEHIRLNHPAAHVVARLVAAMPEYRIVFILRDGRPCVASKARRNNVPLIEAALRWRYAVRVMERLRDLGALAAIVRFEDLVQSPQVVLSTVCRSPEIEFHDEMLRQTNSEELRPEYRSEGFVVEKAVAVPSLPDEVLTIIEPDLRQLGYLVGHADVQG